MKPQPWPLLKYEDYKETMSFVHMLSQIVGKIRLVKMPWFNHSWHTSLYIHPNGFTTGSIPDGHRMFEIKLDFVNHQLCMSDSNGNMKNIPLKSDTIAHYYSEIFNTLTSFNIDASIYASPNEIDPSLPFATDNRDQVYDPEQMKKLWHAFICVHNVFTEFRAKFIGKCSPVHLFWGAFDLAVTRFSGETAPAHPGGMPNMPLKVMQEAYSHEVSSAGFWPGNEQFQQPAFYSYCYPSSPEFGKQDVKPSEAFYSEDMGEYFLTYDTVQASSDPEKTLMDFLQTTYVAATKVGKWDRENLEFDFSEFK